MSLNFIRKNKEAEAAEQDNDTNDFYSRSKARMEKSKEKKWRGKRGEIEGKEVVLKEGKWRVKRGEIEGKLKMAEKI